MRGPRGIDDEHSAGATGRLEQAILFHSLILALWAVFNFFGLFDKRFKKSVESFSATYQFRTPSTARVLVFDGGRIRTRRGTVSSSDYEVTIPDPLALLKSLNNNQNDPLSLVMENKISQSGNLFFLYRFGYLLGLCSARLHFILERLSSPFA